MLPKLEITVDNLASSLRENSSLVEELFFVPTWLNQLTKPSRVNMKSFHPMLTQPGTKSSVQTGPNFRLTSAWHFAVAQL